MKESLDTIEKLSKKIPSFLLSATVNADISKQQCRQSVSKHFIKDHLCFGETGVSKGQTLRMLIDRKSPVISCLCRRYTRRCRRLPRCRYSGLFLPNTDFGNVPDAKMTIHKFSDLLNLYYQIFFINRVGGDFNKSPTSHTTVRTIRYNGGSINLTSNTPLSV